MPFQVVIATRNSAPWVLHFLAAYRDLGVEPLYIVDTRSDDATPALLRAAGANVVLFTPDRDSLEAGMIQYASEHVAEDWILRIDDDEFPTAELLRWSRQTGCKSAVHSWALSRRELIRDGDGIAYSRLWSHYHTPARPDFLNAQVRLYRHRDVAYIEEIHTPGFIAASVDFAPQQAYFVHFDVLLRSLEARIEKLRRYERSWPGSSWKFGTHYLPELLPRQLNNPAPIETHAFDRLLACLPAVPQTDSVTLTVEELRIMHASPFDREAFRLAVAAERRWGRQVMRLARRIEERVANRHLAGFLCGLAKALRPFTKGLPAIPAFLGKIDRAGIRMRNRAEARRRPQA
jgi:hypothetical protein